MKGLLCCPGVGTVVHCRGIAWPWLLSQCCSSRFAWATSQASSPSRAVAGIPCRQLASEGLAFLTSLAGRAVLSSFSRLSLFSIFVTSQSRQISFSASYSLNNRDFKKAARGSFGLSCFCCFVVIFFTIAAPSHQDNLESIGLAA